MNLVVARPASWVVPGGVAAAASALTASWLVGSEVREDANLHRLTFKGPCRLTLAESPPARRTAEQQQGVGSIAAKVQGFHRKGLVEVGNWHEVVGAPPFTSSQIYSTFRYWLNSYRNEVTVTVRNAREQEAAEGLSKREFFDKYGFVLLTHKTAMTAQDWDECSTVLGLPNLTGKGMPKTETQLSRIYAKECRELIKQLVPDARDVELDPLVVRRGPGTKNPIYNFAPHQDYGFTVEDWPMAGPEFRYKWSNPAVEGFMVINFWRPVLPMQGPVTKTPLAVCDPKSVKLEDIVPINVRRAGYDFAKMLDLAYDKDQHWYYYPDMTVDEVLVFKSFQHYRRQREPELNTCFHTAFEVPDPPPGAEERQSCEYRARLWL
eukprot:TRINITY_DN41048_c0_g1_i1.p1 TRINITY_DN41048_c0_g1~~TRINITY_DN41048_c0_g1_i1.p1  ORF type:complete len:378 (-),score=57.98 TRINITY_DN41048_c0_g1_i1:313-1446(-)